MSHFRKILEFQKLLKDYNSVYRDLASIHDKRLLDNDVEHSYRVAMLCWMVVDEYKLKLDIDRILKYALLHDLVEVYAGDISIYGDQTRKAENEHKALLKLKRKFPYLKSMWKALEDYEKKEDKESQFVYIIEKLEPIFVVLLSEDDHWKKRKVTFEDFFERKQKKIKDLDSFAQKFNHDAMRYLRKYKKKYF